VNDPNALLPLALGGRFWEEAADLVGSDDLGLQVARSTRLEGNPLLQQVLRAPTVGAALQTAIFLGSIYNSGQRYWLRRRGDEVRLSRQFAASLRRGRQQVSDFSLMLSIELIRRGAGPEWRPTEIQLEGPAPGHAEQLAALAQKEVRFGGTITVLVFPRSVLALPLPPLGPTLMRAPGRGSLPARDFDGSIRQTIRSLLRMGELDLDVAAEMAGMGVRSLQRRLADAGLSFARLVDEARFEVATRRLRDPTARIVDVSLELGYTDSANFTRAFRRWAGVPPVEFRRAQPSQGAG
jgi:AraC-like DNA-binding protein